MTRSIGIVGGGIVGSTAAYYLSRAGYSVKLYDEGTGQASKTAAGIICPWLSLRRNKPWYYLVSQGAEFYRKLMKDLRHDGYQDEEIFQVCGAIMIRKNSKRIQTDIQQAELKRINSPSMGSVYPLSPQEIHQRFPLIQSDHGGTWVEGGGRVKGDLLVQTLQDAAQKFNCQLMREKVALKSTDKEQVLVQSHNQDYHHDYILLAAGAWLPQLLEPLGYQVDIQPQKGQLYTLKDPAWKENPWPVIIPFGQGDIIPFSDGSLVIGSTHEDGENYDLTINLSALAELKSQADHWLPTLKDVAFDSIRLGTRAQTSDFGVLVGQVPKLDRVWAISGLGSSGLTSGPYLGYQWSQAIIHNSWTLSNNDYPIQKYIQPFK